MLHQTVQHQTQMADIRTNHKKNMWTLVRYDGQLKKDFLGQTLYLLIFVHINR